MSLFDYPDPADQLADYCQNEHSHHPDPDCINCEERKQIIHCATCGADWADGRWFTNLGSTAPNGCDHESFIDDWDQEIRCEKNVWYPTTDRRSAYSARCGFSVVRPGRMCDFHLLAQLQAVRAS